MLNKNKLRAYAKSIELPAVKERPALCRTVCDLIAKEPLFQKATNVGLFVARPNEIDLTPLWFLNREACAFPKVTGPGEMKFYTVSALNELTPGFKGIFEPPTEHPVTEWGEEDLILVPAVGFDLWGNRIGSGLGFYDRFLGTFAKRTPKWGVCFNEQVLLERIPAESFDVAMDAILTPTGFRRR